MPSRKGANVDYSDDGDDYDSQDDISLYSDSGSDSGAPVHDARTARPPARSQAAGAASASAPAQARQGRARGARGEPLPRDARGKLRSKSPGSGRDSPPGTPRANTAEVREDTWSSAMRARVAFVGPAGAGKTSLLGYLSCLVESGKTLPLAAVEATAKEAGRPLAAYAWLLDRTIEERAYGTAAPRECVIPMSSGSFFWSRDAIAVDCPDGGAITCESVLRVMASTDQVTFVVSAIEEEFESGASCVTTLLEGAKALKLTVAAFSFLVNKMDAVGYQVAAFKEIRTRLGVLFEKSTGEKLDDENVVPMAAALGENVARLAPWLGKMSANCALSLLTSGKTTRLLSGLSYSYGSNGVFAVDEVVRPDVILGMGGVNRGCRVLPSGVVVRVTEIRNAETGTLCTHAGATRTQLTISPACPDIFPGCLLVASDSPTYCYTHRIASFIKAKVTLRTLNGLSGTITPATPLTMRIHNYEGRVRLLAITRLRGPKGHWSASGGSAIGKFTDAEIVIESLDHAVPFCCVSRGRVQYCADNFFNRVFFYTHGRLVAAGIVEESLDKKESEEQEEA